jgi:hypothetical protein
MDKDTIRKICNIQLETLVGFENVYEWWTIPNAFFKGRTPIDVFDEDPWNVLGYLISVTEGY